MEVDVGLFKCDERYVLMLSEFWTFIRVRETNSAPNPTYVAVESRPTRVWIHRESAILAAEEDWDRHRKEGSVPHLAWTRHALDDDGTVYAEPDLWTYYQVYPVRNGESEE